MQSGYPVLGKSEIKRLFLSFYQEYWRESLCQYDTCLSFESEFRIQLPEVPQWRRISTVQLPVRKGLYFPQRVEGSSQRWNAKSDFYRVQVYRYKPWHKCERHQNSMRPHTTAMSLLHLTCWSCAFGPWQEEKHGFRQCFPRFFFWHLAASSSFCFNNLQTILLVIACGLRISFQVLCSVVCRLSTIANRVHHGVLGNAAWHVDKGLTSRYKKLVPRHVRSSAALTLVWKDLGLANQNQLESQEGICVES